jgi:hypothetical protein
MPHTDDVISDIKPLLLARGKYITDAAATAVMTKKDGWVQFSLTANSLVVPTLETSKPHNIPTAPMTVNQLLEKLETLGFTVIKLRCHTITRAIPSAAEQS